MKYNTKTPQAVPEATMMTTYVSPYTWTIQDDVHRCTFKSKDDDVLLGTMKLVEGKWACFVIINYDGDHLTCSLSSFEHAQQWIQSGGRTKYCAECNAMHECIAFCDCGACLYEHSTWIKDDMYPLFRCTKCKKVNFWD